MITEPIKNKITAIWDNYIEANKTVLDTRGNVISDIDDKRVAAIGELKLLIEDFLAGALNVFEFKTALDSYNKRNNLWGFTATKGQMFFNQLVKTNESNTSPLESLLRQVIVEPQNLSEALEKLDTLGTFVNHIFESATDKRKVPNPGSVNYFLSYFWQIHDHLKWPIFYTSLISAFKELDIWQEQQTQKENYKFFYYLNDEIKTILKAYTSLEITNWDAEHCFWNFKGSDVLGSKKAKQEPSIVIENIQEVEITTNFNIKDYLIPKVSNLVELGAALDKSASSKGSEYEKAVADIFKLLDFEVDLLGQGSGRNPDAIIKYREENTAFIVDAKAYSNGYSLGIDDRAIREYINYHCPRLLKDGYKKIGFIIVSNFFKTNFDGFINDITWNSDVKRFILLTSEALLYLLAYKTRDKLNLSSIIENMISFGNVVTAQDIITRLDDI